MKRVCFFCGDLLKGNPKKVEVEGLGSNEVCDFCYSFLDKKSEEQNENTKPIFGNRGKS